MSAPTHKLPAAECPACGTVNDRASPVDPQPPNPMDVAICIRCGSLGVYTPALSLRAPTMIEVNELMQMPQVVHAVRAWHQAFGGAKQ